jgi:hypothetical protein
MTSFPRSLAGGSFHWDVRLVVATGAMAVVSVSDARSRLWGGFSSNRSRALSVSAAKSAKR